MADERVEIEIVLDDGSIQKGFVKVQKQAQKAAKESESFFSTSFKRLGGLAAGLGAAVAGVAAAVGARASIRAAAQQEQAIQNLNTALRNAGTFSQEASRSIQDFATELQRTTQFGDEVVLQQVALARNFARTNEEAVQLVEAAVDLSAATGLTLDSAVRNLGKTFSGLTGELGESLPALRNLTAEQLRAGDAIKLVSDLFGGTAQQNVLTFTGRIEQLSNNFGDVLEGLGQFVTRLPVLNGLLGVISGRFADVASSLKSFTEEGESLEALNEGFISFGQSVVTFVIAPVEAAGQVVFALFKSIENGLQTILGATAGLAEGFLRVFSVIGGAGGKLTDNFEAAFQAIRDQSAVTAEETNKALGSIGEFDEGTVSGNLFTLLEEFRTVNQELVKISDDAQKQVAENTQNTVTLSLQGAFDIVGEQLTFFAEKIIVPTAEQIATARAQFEKDFKRIGASARDGLGRGVGQAFAAFGRALAEGENAFQAFTNAIIGAIGQGAIALGTEFILRGIAYQFVPGLQALGPPLIAAGAGLAAFGGVLSAVGGGGGGGAAGGGGGGGVATAEAPGGDTGGLSLGEVAEEDQPTTQVAINVEGTVLDPVSVGNQIADILNDSFEAGGTRVVTV